jgi:large subunit ribosomal protein L22
MEAIAKTKYLKGSPRKTRLVIDMIRGEDVSRALAILKFTDKRAADPIEKTLRSAIANATYLAEQQNIAVDPDDLWVRNVSSIWARPSTADVCVRHRRDVLIANSDTTAISP